MAEERFRAGSWRGRGLHLALLMLLVTGWRSGVRAQGPRQPYYGRPVGRLTSFAHGIQGMVYAVDEATLFVKGFAYDGTGPDAFFWAGDTQRPSPQGFIIPYPEDYPGRDPPILKRYTNADILLRLPGGKKIKDIKWLSVWCRRFTVNFGEVMLPPDLDPPRPRVLPEFRRLAHGLRSGNVTVLDAKTFYIPNLHYDGAGPDAYFWVGNGSEPNPYGVKVPNEMGSLEPLRGYQGEDIEIQLPGRMTVYDVEWLAVWCVQYKHNFGHVLVPKDLDVPPALGQTKITPPWWYNPTSSSSTQPPPGGSSSSSCRELLDKRLQVSWEIQGDQIYITLAARLKDGQYMAFGLSGVQGRNAMMGADIVVAHWDTYSNQGRVQDYTVSSIAQCDGQRGVCPDQRVGGINDAFLVSSSKENGITRVQYRRPLAAHEPGRDRAVPSAPTSVVAAFGPLNSNGEANAHSFMDKTTQHTQIDFGALNDNTCIGLAELDASGPKPWPPRVISGVNVFTARIGPTGGKRGYTPITGHPSWGIAWYINDQLIPELYVHRGESYTFLVEGGDDRTNPAKFHPFYICDSSEGGFGQKSDDEKRRQRVFAGVGYDNENYPYPTAVGRYCEWAHKSVDMSASSETFEEYFNTLELQCQPGEPANLTWTVAPETPDLVYYQCYTHSNLGWKIHVLDPGAPVPGRSGDRTAAAPPLALSAPLSILLALLLLLTLHR